MEVSVTLDETLVEELDEEADLQGFEDLEGYMRWIIAHRPMSDLASMQAPAVTSRVSELEERVTVLERQLDLDPDADPATDLGDNSTSGPSLDADLGDDGGTEPTISEELGGDSTEPDEAEADDEDAAADDDIAEAIGDVSLDDEE